MSTADSASNLDARPGQSPSSASGAPGGAGTIWLDGDVLACACPDCGAPMSVRLWLLLADCWRCGTSIELTEEQEREALRLLEARESRRSSPAAPVPPPAPAPQPARSPRQPAKLAVIAPPEQPPAAPPPVSPPPVAPQRSIPAVPLPAAPRRMAAALRPSRALERLRQIEAVGEVQLFWRELFRDLPAWLASLVVHMVLLIVLALWMLGEDDKNRPVELVLSTQTNLRERPGENVVQPEPDPIEFEDPGDDAEPQEAPEEAEEPPAKEPVAEQDDPAPPLGNLPDPALPPFGLASGQRGKAMFAGRKATARAELVEREGGTRETEAAVARGLKWLARHQNEDGSWSLHNFHRSGDCRGRCHHQGYQSDVAGTALALLPFLGAGQTHLEGEYQEVVGRGLRWLIEHQKSNGDFPSPFRNTHMYAHGQAAIALCEAYALTYDAALRDPAQRAIDFIVDAQHPDGGWRYEPGQPGDTSVVGWQLMALRSAQMGYLEVPPEVFQRAARYLDQAQTDSLGARYAYMPGGGATPVMTAEALLCRQYSGWPHHQPGLLEGVRWLLDAHPPKRSNVNMYYWYYATQVMHHQGGEAWDQWNYQMRDLLVDLQETRGHEAGSWAPGRSGHDDAGGRLYMTALAVCTLEVYYRHLPLYRQSAVDP